MQIVQWLVAAMFAWTPAREVDRARYTEIASDIVTVAYDPAERPIFYGPDGRAKTALLLASIAAHESTFREDVETGRVRGDGGTSWCFMQLHIGPGKTHEGWSGADLTTDRKTCFRAGLHVALYSFRLCKDFPTSERLSAYASGQCGHLAVSRAMVARAIAYSAHHPVTDQHLEYVEKNVVLTKRDVPREDGELAAQTD